MCRGGLRHRVGPATRDSNEDGETSTAMLNPYGVQRLYDLGLEELERQHGRQAGRCHEVGAGRRRKAAAARDSLMLAQADVEPAPSDVRGPSLAARVRQL